MKRIIQEEVSREIDIELPFYVKLGDNHFTEVADDKHATVVKTYSFCTGIEIVGLDQCNPFGNNGWEFTTKEVFEAAYLKASERLYRPHPVESWNS